MSKDTHKIEKGVMEEELKKPGKYIFFAFTVRFFLNFLVVQIYLNI